MNDLHEPKPAKSSSKFQIICFVLITFLVSWSEEYWMIKQNKGVENTLATFCLMWTPGLVGLILSFCFGNRFREIGFRKGNLKSYLLAYFIPAATSVLVLVALLLSGIGTFGLSPALAAKAGGSHVALFKLLILGPTIGTVIGFTSALGEEIGWRGFLHSRLIAMNVRHPFLITGIIWAIWHWPLILFSDYATSDYPVVSLILFTLSIISYSVFMGYLRENSGSVFPAALAHGSHNLWIQAIYPAFITKGVLDPYFGGESGVFIVIFYAILASYIYRKKLVAGRLKPV